MPRGMKRTTIMSHGRLHDSTGVRGTHLKGTVPSSKVLDAIPPSANTVANIPGTARPGTVGEVTRESKPTQVRTSKLFIPRIDEGVPVLPGGNRDLGGGSLGTSRPQLDAPEFTRSSSGQIPAPIRTHDDVTKSAIQRAVTEDEAKAAGASVKRVPEPVAPPPEPTPVEAEDAFVEPPTETEGENAEETLSVSLPNSKRQVKRAKLSVLLEWCKHLDIDPNEYVDEDEPVTGDLMRELVAEVQGIDLE